jgi:heme-degrading protein
MLKTIALASALVQLGLALAMPANAQLLTHMDLSLDTALAIAQGAMAACKAKGHRVSVTVVGRLGEVIVQLRGDNASPTHPKAVSARPIRHARSAPRPNSSPRSSTDPASRRNPKPRCRTSSRCRAGRRSRLAMT